MALRSLLPATVAVLACLIGASPVRAYDALGPGAIVASVRDRDGKPIPGALVTALGPAERHATTLLAGIVTLVALPLGTYRVRIVKAGYETTEAAITLGTVRGFGSLDVRLVRSNQGTAPESLSGTAVVRPVGDNDPLLAHTLVTLPGVDLPAIASATAAYETRVSLDGIPLGGPSSGAASLRPDALPLQRVAVISGADALAPNLDGVVGGDIDLQTQPAVRARDAAASAGYDSGFGSFQQIGGGEWSGPVSASLAAVTGGGLERDRVLRANYALSSTTSLGFDSYSFARNADLNAVSPVTEASEPAYSARLSTRVLGGALDLRSFGSDYAAQGSSERLQTFAAAFERPLGAGNFGLDVARTADGIDGAPAGGGLRFPAGTRSASDDEVTGPGNALRQTTTVTGLLGFKLGQSGRLDLSDSRSAGTGIGTRNDPRAALSLPLAGAWTFRADAGSAYVSAPYELVSVNAAAVTYSPETSFGYRAGADLALSGGSTLSLGTFGLTRWNRFATLASARSQGIDVEYAHPAPGVGLGFDAGLGLAHDVAFGPPQPAARIVQSVPLGGGEIPGVADTRARLGFTYRTAKGMQFSATALSLGPNNGITAGTLHYADLAASVPVFHYFSLRMDGATPLGSVAPRTLSLSLGAAAGAR
jgi:hypothetical protein